MTEEEWRSDFDTILGLGEYILGHGDNVVFAIGPIFGNGNGVEILGADDAAAPPVFWRLTATSLTTFILVSGNCAVHLDDRLVASCPHPMTTTVIHTPLKQRIAIVSRLPQSHLVDNLLGVHALGGSEAVDKVGDRQSSPPPPCSNVARRSSSARSGRFAQDAVFPRSPQHWRRQA